MGRPSVFLRLSGCNLQCVWCDTPYTWNWEGAGFTHADGRAFQQADEQLALPVAEVLRLLEGFDCRNLVLTGGEPLAQRRRVVGLLRELAADWTIDVETNGTIQPSPELRDRVATWVVSPKLGNSGLEGSKAVVPSAIHSLIETGRAFFKFVVRSGEDIGRDIGEISAFVDEFGLRGDRVFLMPEARTAEELAARESEVADYALAKGWRYSDRLHIRIYGGGRGV